MTLNCKLLVLRDRKAVVGLSIWCGVTVTQTKDILLGLLSLCGMARTYELPF